MSIIKDGGRTDIETPFRNVSFTHADAESLASRTPVHRILPDLVVMKIGGSAGDHHPLSPEKNDRAGWGQGTKDWSSSQPLPPRRPPRRPLRSAKHRAPRVET